MRFLYKHSKKLLLVLGIIGLLISVFLLISGGICLARNNWVRDSEGYYKAWDFQVKKDSCAIVIKSESIEFASGEGDTQPITNFRIEALNNTHANRTFIGLSAESDINTYLTGAGYDEITDLGLFPVRVDYLNHPGDGSREKPESQSFWVDSAYGIGTQTLTWKLKTERYSLVIMNGDGSAGLDMNVIIGSKSPLFVIIGIGHIFSGVVIFLISGFMTSFATVKVRNAIYPEPLGLLHQRRMKSKTNN